MSDDNVRKMLDRAASGDYAPMPDQSMGLSALEAGELPSGADALAWPWSGFRAIGIEKYLCNKVEGVGVVAAGKVGKAAAAVPRCNLTTVIKAAYKELVASQADAVRHAMTKPISDKGGMPWFHEASMLALSVGMNKTQTISFAFEHKKEARRALLADPFEALRPVRGAGWNTADSVFLSLGFPEDDTRRLHGAVMLVLEEQANDGHTYVWTNHLNELVLSKCGIDKGLVSKALDKLEEIGEVQRWKGRVYLRRLLIAERIFAREIKRLVERDLPPIPNVDTTGLDPSQVKAVESIARSPVSILDGGPGTGKTTTVTRLARAAIANNTAYDQPEEVVGLAALAARAAARMSEVSGLESKTIHRTLGYGGKPPELWDNEKKYQAGSTVEYMGRHYRALFNTEEGDEPGINKSWSEVMVDSGPIAGAGTANLPCDLLIVDEFSMVDIELAAHLVSAVPDSCRLLIVGDVEQLPSIGPGAVMHDLSTHPAVPVNTLTTVHRQDVGSMIPKRAQEVRNNAPRVAEWSTEQAKDDRMCLLTARDNYQIASMVVKMVTKSIPRRYGIKPEDIQVLTPVRDGAHGMYELNRALRKALNPCPPGGNDKFLRKGDKVMETRNRPEMKRSNGDIGWVQKVWRDGSAEVQFVNGVSLYNKQEAKSLKPAYAVTIHKAQGSEFNAVVIAMSRSNTLMLKKPLIYTGLTRAVAACVIIATDGAVEAAVGNTRDTSRRTGLQAMFESYEPPEPEPEPKPEVIKCAAKGGCIVNVKDYGDLCSFHGGAPASEQRAVSDELEIW